MKLAQGKPVSVYTRPEKKKTWLSVLLSCFCSFNSFLYLSVHAANRFLHPFILVMPPSLRACLWFMSLWLSAHVIRLILACCNACHVWVYASGSEIICTCASPGGPGPVSVGQRYTGAGVWWQLSLCVSLFQVTAQLLMSYHCSASALRHQSSGSAAHRETGSSSPKQDATLEIKQQTEQECSFTHQAQVCSTCVSVWISMPQRVALSRFPPVFWGNGLQSWQLTVGWARTERHSLPCLYSPSQGHADVMNTSFCYLEWAVHSLIPFFFFFFFCQPLLQTCLISERPSFWSERSCLTLPKLQITRGGRMLELIERNFGGLFVTSQTKEESKKKKKRKATWHKEMLLVTSTKKNLN